MQYLYQNIENFDIDEERKKIIKDKIILQQEQDKFENKYFSLKQKILQINDRHKKLIEIEKELKEKNIKLNVKAKKQEYYKQAIDEEWQRIDCKKQNVLKCKQLVEDEWKKLRDEVHSFENFKKKL